MNTVIIVQTFLSPVSYTHLDVYKRQCQWRVIVSLERELGQLYIHMGVLTEEREKKKKIIDGDSFIVRDLWRRASVIIIFLKVSLRSVIITRIAEACIGQET